MSKELEAPSAQSLEQPRTWMDLAREVFPGKDNAFLDYVLWEHTGFPEFWNIPEDGPTPEACCRSQLERYRDFGRACYRCGAYGSEKHGRPVMPRNGIVCRTCRKIMRRDDMRAAPKAP